MEAGREGLWKRVITSNVLCWIDYISIHRICRYSFQLTHTKRNILNASVLSIAVEPEVEDGMFVAALSSEAVLSQAI